MASGEAGIDLVGEAATEAAGAVLGAALRRGDLLALTGELGAGKTTLVRGLARGLGVEAGAVRSPTFVLHNVYRGRTLDLHHLDVYRLGAGADLAALDLDDLLAEGAVVVEWADLAAGLERLSPAWIRLEEPARDRRRLLAVGAAPHHIAAALGSLGR